MTVRGFAYRLAYIVLFTWIFGSIFDSPGWALYFALLPFAFYEMLRCRGPRREDESEPDKDL